MEAKHAMVLKDGFNVPLIGVPPTAVLETCDVCGNEYSIRDLSWNGKQMECAKCRSSDANCDSPLLNSGRP